MLKYRTFGYGHSFGVLSHYYGREAGLELREDIDTVLEPGMVISMEPMLTIPEGEPGAGGYREHDILFITEDGNEDITKYPLRPRFQRRWLRQNSLKLTPAGNCGAFLFATFQRGLTARAAVALGALMFF